MGPHGRLFEKRVPQSAVSAQGDCVGVSALARAHRGYHQCGAHPSLIFDYHGFPPHTYKLTYPAAGAPALAARIADLLQAQGIPAQQDAQRGFDHGVFIPLKLVFLHADIRVVQVSLHNSLDPVQHINTLGQPAIRAHFG